MGALLLPYYGNGDDVEKIVRYLSTKPRGSSESDLARTLGEKFIDARKHDFYDFVGLFTRESGVYQLTPLGVQFHAADGTARNAIIANRIRGFRPYESVIDWAFHNGVDVLDTDRVKHAWVHKLSGELDLTNKYRLDSAPLTFFCACQMAGLGTFLIGRRGSKSRIEFDRSAVEKFLGMGTGSVSHDGPIATQPGDLNLPAVTPQTNPSPPAPSPEIGGRKDGFIFTIPVHGKVAKLVWPESSMTAREWEKLKRVGDAMFLDEPVKDDRT